MFKLFKNLKSSAIVILLITVLLVVQAMVDLELPSYISKIVDVGIQSGGIGTAVPKAVSKDVMDDILFLTNDDEKILSNYDLVVEADSISEEQKKELEDIYVAGYDELLTANSVYLLKDISAEELQALEETMIKPLTIYASYTVDPSATEIKNQILSGFKPEQKIAFQDSSIFEILAIMPVEIQNQMINASIEEINKMPEMIVDQAGILAIKQIYQNENVDLDKIQSDYILKIGLIMLGIAALSMIIGIAVLFLSSRLAAKLGKTLREKVYSKVMKFSNKELREFSTASLITRSTNDIQQVQQLITMLFRVVVYAPILGIGGIYKVYTQTDGSLTWIIGVAILAIIFVIGTLFIILMPRFKKLQSLIDKLNLVSREILTGLPVIRAFNKKETEEKRFNKASLDLRKVNSVVNGGMSLMMPLLMFIMNTIMVVIIWVGAGNVEAGTLQVGDLMAFMQYTMQVVMAFLMISIISIMLPRAVVSAKRINEIIDTDISIKDKNKEELKEFDEAKKGIVEFKNVTFSYPDGDIDVLTNISFTANPGQTTAIIGSTGSGKSTLVNLIPRFYDTTKGEVLVGGVNIKDVEQEKLRDKIGFIAQKGILFSGTIESNIKYSNPDMNDENMINAAKIAQAEDFISVKEKHYKDEIAQGGNNVSGGQKQRLSIARAIAKNPEIYIFDDSFSALDLKTDSKLREELKGITEDKTVIIVAQRINTIINADKIVVLEEGNIIGQGTHSQLLQNNQTYKEIALSQMTEEELQMKGDE